MDADILLDDSSATESEIECVSDMHIYHSTSPEKAKHTTTDTMVDINQSNMGGKAPSMDHSKVFMKSMSMYMIRGSTGEEEGLNNLYLVHSRFKIPKPSKDGRKTKKCHKGELNMKNAIVRKNIV